jgi:hypothetical protein
MTIQVDRQLTPRLLLKWGTLKGWEHIPEANQDLVRRFLDGSSWACANDQPSDDRKAILCELIRAHTGDIQNDWDGEHYTQEQAVDYVMNYGKAAQKKEDSDVN